MPTVSRIASHQCRTSLKQQRQQLNGRESMQPVFKIMKLDTRKVQVIAVDKCQWIENDAQCNVWTSTCFSPSFTYITSKLWRLKCILVFFVRESSMGEKFHKSAGKSLYLFQRPGVLPLMKILRIEAERQCLFNHWVLRGFPKSQQLYIRPDSFSKHGVARRQSEDLQQCFGGRVAESRTAVHNHAGELTVNLQSCLGQCFALLKLSEVKYLARR